MYSGEDMRQQSPQRAPRWNRMLLTSILAAACFGAAAGDTLYVGRISLPIRTGKFAFDKVVGTALQGETVKVIGAEGRYLKVAYTPTGKTPVQGYVLQDALSPVAPVVATTRDTGNAAEIGAVGAGKGVLDSKAFAASHGLTPEPFYAMVTDSRRSMENADASFEDFMKAGKIGLYKPRPATQP